MKYKWCMNLPEINKTNQYTNMIILPVKLFPPSTQKHFFKCLGLSLEAAHNMAGCHIKATAVSTMALVTAEVKLAVAGEHNYTL